MMKPHRRRGAGLAATKSSCELSCAAQRMLQTPFGRWKRSRLCADPIVRSIPVCISSTLSQAHTNCASHFLLFSFRSFASESSQSETEETQKADVLTDLVQYHRLADETLELYQEELSQIQDVMTDFDCECSMGVLTIRIGGKGTYVINKQTPNRQLWWSSPISGPKRYFYDTKKKQWLNTRDGTPMAERLKQEIKELTGITLSFKDPQ